MPDDVREIQKMGFPFLKSMAHHGSFHGNHWCIPTESGGFWPNKLGIIMDYPTHPKLD